MDPFCVNRLPVRGVQPRLQGVLPEPVQAIGSPAPGPVRYSQSMNEFLVSDPHFPRFLALLLAFLLVVVWLRSQPEWLLVVLPIFAVTFLGFDRLAEGVMGLVASGDIARLVLGAILMAGPAFAVGFALGRRARWPGRALASPVGDHREAGGQETATLDAQTPR